MPKQEIIDVSGIWELETRDLEPQKSRGYNQELSFWMKFLDEKFIMANSNNRHIGNRGGRWSYNAGTWWAENDTIKIRINEVGDISTNTGFSRLSKMDSLFSEQNIVRFLINKRSEDRLEFTALDPFMFSKPPLSKNSKSPNQAYLKVGYVGIEIGECFVLKKINKKYFWTNYK